MKPIVEKTKKNMTALDITALVNDLKEKIVGLRVSNIFDINPKTYVFKFARNEKKECLIIESGVRFHTTAAKIEKSKIPSGFTMKFRRYLRAKKLEKISQIGCERVVDMQFGSDNAFHILLEFYSQGNIILTDKDYVILQLIRSHAFTENSKTALGEKYPFEHAAKLSLDKFDVSAAFVASCIQKQQDNQENNEEAVVVEEKPQKKGKTANKPKPVPATNTRKYKDLLFQVLPCLNPALTDHLLKVNDINPNNKCSMEDLETLRKVSEFSLKFLEEFSTARHKGYLVVSANSKEEEIEEEIKVKEEEKKMSLLDEKKNTIVYVDFAPCLLVQNEGKKVKIFDTFDAALDVYFSSMEVKSERVEFEQKAWKKYENIKQDQEKRLETLKTEQEEYLVKASLIEKNVQDIEAIINIIKTMINSGLSWDKITKMINESKKTGDALANMIYKTEWEQNEVIILLSDPEHEDLEADLTPVQINFTISAFQNAKLYYENKKKHFVKEKKTIEASQQALKIAEKNAMQEINKNKDKTDVLNARKTYWFEKFYWFISSENYLVLSGRDGQQNELLVKKYFQKGDIYLHADYHGASSTIVKNPNKNENVPNTTLEEAAIYAAARSKAWENKILPGTWWVYYDQVSKSAPSGEYLPTGSFMIRGKKNFLNPPKLELGVGFMFKIDESCLAAHTEDRQVKKIEGMIQEIEENKEEKIEEKMASEEYTLVTMSELQPRIKNVDKTGKGKNEGKKKDEQNKGKTEKKTEEKKQEKEKEKKEEKKNPNNQLDNLPRGKKTKLKKMKEKYEDQDEDERQIKMKLIGASEMKLGKTEKDLEVKEPEIEHKKNKKDKKDKKGSKKNKIEDFVSFAVKNEKTRSAATEEKEAANKEETTDILSKEEGIETLKKEEIEDLQENPVATKERENIVATLNETAPIKDEKIQENVEKKPEENEEMEEIKEKEDGNEDDIEEALEKQRIKEEEEQLEKNQDAVLNLDKSEWNALVGNPLPEDTYFFIVPVCAPINSIQGYKYKIKLVPGTLKKGKAAKTISQYFLAQKDLNTIDRKLIKGLSDFDLINDLIGGVKLVGSGVQKIRDQEKKSKRDKKTK